MRTQSAVESGLKSVAASAVMGAALLLPSASAHASSASRTETRQVAAFDKVAVANGIHLILEVGPHAALRVEGRGEDLERLETVVSDGALQVRFKGHTGNLFSMFGTHTNSVTVTAVEPALHGVEASGGAHAEGRVGGTGKLAVEASGGAHVAVERLGAGELDVEASGGGHVEVAHVDAPELSMEASGGGHLDVEGRANHARLEVSGGAHVNGEKLTVATLEVEASGGGHGRLRVEKSVSGRATGGGHVTIDGNPSGRVRASSGGSVSMNERE